MTNIDKWISLICGNIIYAGTNSRGFFNSTLKDPHLLLKLVTQERSYFPDWVRQYFSGIDLTGNTRTINLSALDLNRVNFSFSNLVHCDFSNAYLYNANFAGCRLHFCEFSEAYLRGAKFENAQINNYSQFALANIEQSIYFPYSLAEKAMHKQRHSRGVDRNLLGILVNYGSDITYISHFDDVEALNFGEHMGHLLRSGFKDEIWSLEEIKSSFKIENPLILKAFEQGLENSLFKSFE